MKIEIRQPLKPFSHRPGTTTLIPGTTDRITLFPTCIEGPQGTINLPLTGPIAQFTVMLDLEKMRIAVWGIAQEGYFRYFIDKEGISLDRDHTNQLNNLLNTKTTHLPKTLHRERLSLGNHKKQEWDQIIRRNDLREILPHWLCLGSYTPVNGKPLPASLIQLKSVVQERNGLLFYDCLKNLFRSRFQGILSPLNYDPLHQGIGIKVDPEGSEMAFLQHSAALIRRAFVDENRILPCVPPQFHCGRMCHVHLEGMGVLHLEWSKKQIRRIVVVCDCEGSMPLIFSSDIRQFRLRRHRLDKGTLLKSEDSLDYRKGEVLWIDRFTK